MEFKRVETRRVYRHIESISDAGEIKTILGALLKHNLKFTMKVRNIGGTLIESSVLGVSDDKVKIFARRPQKTTMDVAFNDIEQIEVESNIDLNETDYGGRWSGIIT